MIYEYQCNDCKEIFEAWVKVSEMGKQQKCPKCESENILKLISTPAFHLKGGGWYRGSPKE